MAVCRFRTMRRAALVLGALLTTAVVPAQAVDKTAAQAPWPCKVVRFVVPYPPGGSSDMLARLIAPKLMQRFATTIIVENKSGFGGTIGTAQVASAAGDGCTWLLGNATPIVVSRNFHALSPDPTEALAAVAELAAVPLVFYVNQKQLPVSDMKSLAALLRANPDRYSHASPGSGTPHHLLAEQFKLAERVSATHVPYRGSGPAIADVLAGHVSFAVEAMSAISPHLQSSKIRVLATSGAQRSASLPDVPTMQELGYGNFVVTNWYGLFVPRGTPAALVVQLNGAVREIVKTPDVAQALAQMGAFNAAYRVEQYQQFVAAEVQYWAAFVRQSGVQID